MNYCIYRDSHGVCFYNRQMCCPENLSQDKIDNCKANPGSRGNLEKKVDLK